MGFGPRLKLRDGGIPEMLDAQRRQRRILCMAGGEGEAEDDRCGDWGYAE